MKALLEKVKYFFKVIYAVWFVDSKNRYEECKEDKNLENDL